MEEFRISDEANLKNWLANNSQGIVINSKPAGFNVKYAVLHRSTCESFTSTGNSMITYSKYCFQNTSSLVNELLKQNLIISDLAHGCTKCCVDRVLPTTDELALESRVELLIQLECLEKPIGNKEPKKTSSTISEIIRDPQVIAWVKKRANGVCELCSGYAPFNTNKGSPYLEVHHVVPLSEHGEDTVENCVALCPNCHRAAHYSNKALSISVHLKRLAHELNNLSNNAFKTDSQRLTTSVQVSLSD